MDFSRRYPLSLLELLVSPVIFRENMPVLAGLPWVTARGMQDLARFGGYRSGAIRTALSRLRTSGQVECTTDEQGVERFRMGALQRSVSQAVQRRFKPPEGFLLALFSFSAKETLARNTLRTALKHHGFQRLAQNAYINGEIDTSEIEMLADRLKLSDNLFLFRCPEVDDPRLRARLLKLFDVAGRARVLRRLQADLKAYLGSAALEDEEFARRLFYAGPVHFRITHSEEPPLPVRYLPADYPLEDVRAYLGGVAQKRAAGLIRYYRSVNS